MKLFKFALLIPLSKTNVEQGFSKMNLLISPFHSSLGNNSIIRWLCLDEPENVSDETIGKLTNTFIATGCRIDF